MPDISNSEDILDSRDIIDRIEELEGERTAMEEAIEEAQDAYDSWLSDREDSDGESDAEREQGEDLFDTLALERKALAEWLESDAPAELKSLKDFADQLEGYGDWEHGETLIRHDHFTEYCQDMLEDIGDLPKDLPGYIVIDWEATASNLKVDYTESDLDGVTYYMRA